MTPNKPLVKADTDQLGAAIRWHQQGDLSKAESIYRSLLIRHPNHADALNLLGLIAYQKKKYTDALRLIQKAIANQDKNPDYHNNLGTVLKALGRPADARHSYLTALALKPDNADTCYNMGGLCLEAGELDDAISFYQRTIANQSDYHSAYTNLSAIYNSRKDYAQALACCRQAIRSGANNAALYNNMGNALKALGQWEQAGVAFKNSIQLDPTATQAYCNWGNTLHEMGNSLQAISSYRKALDIDPNNTQALNCLGTVLAATGQFQEAMGCYHTAIQLSPRDAIPYHNMGNGFLDLGKNQEAAKCFERSLQLDPQLVEAHISFGIVFQELGQPMDAQVCFEKAIDLRPQYAKPYGHLVRTFQHECDWQGINQYGPILDALTQEALDNRRVPDEGPFLHLTRHCDPGKNHLVAKAWSDQLAQRIRAESRLLSAVSNRKNSSNAKITVGYLSNNFKNHPTAHLISGMFNYHNRDRFSIVGYSYGKNDHSAYRHQIEADCDRFVDIESTDHETAARRIAQDGVDILIDLVGFMKSNRLAIPALRPAPVQVRWLGMAGTCGADFFDYIITDEIVTPRDQDTHYSETFCYMPHTYQINSTIKESPDIQVTKKEAGLPEKKFVFCSFCSTYKIEPTIFSAWMRILGDVPDSVLWLLAPSLSAQKHLQESALNHGIDPQRMVFAPKMDRNAHLARIACADLGLDTVVVNGAATTSEALWRGVPVLTVRGAHFASRMASSILTAVEMPEMVAETLDDYVRLAVRVSQDRVYWAELKNKLDVKRLSAPLFDTRQFVKNLESRYEQMWRCHENKMGKTIIGGQAQE